MRFSKPRILVALVLTILVIALSPWLRQSAQRTWTLQDYSKQHLTWHDCFTSYQCADLRVPVDYNNLTAGEFQLQVLKHPATVPGRRIGTLVVNPGGPGASAVDYAYGATEIVSSVISQSFDIVGYDPRGVGASQPFRCFNDQQTDEYLAADGSATTSSQINTLVSYAKSFATACSKAVGDKLGHYSTLETAKDMELLRIALGEPKLNFLGKSYGTYLGTLYAQLYPKQVGRFVLDGAVDPNSAIRDQNLVQAIGFETALDDFFKQASTFTKAEVEAFLQRSETVPLKSGAGRQLTPSLIIIGMAASLYENQSGWPSLEAALKSALTQGDPVPLLQLADGYTNRDSSGHYADNQNDISQVISCLDWPDRRTVAQIAAENATYAKAAPIFGPFLTFAGLACHYFKPAPQLLGRPIGDIPSAPVLVVAVSKDPATPLVWAEALAKDFRSARLAIVKGEGHTGYYRGNSCIDQAVNRYLLEGSLPVRNLTCTA